MKPEKQPPTAFRATEGRWETVYIDDKTPLPQLIDILKNGWAEVETGKGYWIGYTDNMYSIAYHGDEAIRYLTELIDKSQSKHTKIGALYTLHLIGINSEITGRFSEKFVNKNARAAILKYLNDSELHTTVVFLTMRDPWLSDLPHLMAYLSLPNKDYSRVVSALSRYHIKNVSISTCNNSMVSLMTLHDKYMDSFLIDTEITNSVAWENSFKQYSSNKNAASEIELNTLIFYISIPASFCNFNRYSYTNINDKIMVYGPKKASEIWLNWWKQLARDKKNYYTATYNSAAVQ